jgi:hypothetical protein
MVKIFKLIAHPLLFSICPHMFQNSSKPSKLVQEVKLPTCILEVHCSNLGYFECRSEGLNLFHPHPFKFTGHDYPPV